MRALHFVRENARVEAAKGALESSDVDAFFKNVLGSGKSSFEYLQNVYTVKAVDDQGLSLALALTDGFMQTHDGAFRVHGGGFAGTVQAFVPNDMLEEFRNGVEKMVGAGSCHVLSIREAGGIELTKEM